MFCFLVSLLLFVENVLSETASDSCCCSFYDLKTYINANT